MANGHVQIHDPMSDRRDPEARGTGGDGDGAPEDLAHTPEFRLLMAYNQRRRGPEVARSPGRRPDGPPSDAESEVTLEMKKKKKKKTSKKMWKLLRCIKPKTQDEDLEPAPAMSPGVMDRAFGSERVSEKDELEEAASQLAKIAEEVPFVRPEIEADMPSNNNAEVERVIGLLLRDAGDRFNEQELKDLTLAGELFWNYDFFRSVVNALLSKMGLRSPDPESPGPHASPKTQIAVACEATSRLTAVDAVPEGRVLGYGARYLSEHYTSWVQKQGGYVEAFYSDNDDDDDDDDDDEGGHNQ